MINNPVVIVNHVINWLCPSHCCCALWSAHLQKMTTVEYICWTVTAGLFCSHMPTISCISTKPHQHRAPAVKINMPENSDLISTLMLWSRNKEQAQIGGEDLPSVDADGRNKTKECEKAMSCTKSYYYEWIRDDHMMMCYRQFKWRLQTLSIQHVAQSADA